MVERVALSCGEHIGGIDGEDAHLEASTCGHILSITLVGMLVVITRTNHEAVVVVIFHTPAPRYLLHLFLETVGGIVERLEDTRDGRNVVVFALHAIGVVLVCLALFLLGIGGHKEFVGIGSNRESIILVERYRHVASQAQVRGYELRIVITAVGYLRTDIVDVQTPGKGTFAVAHHEISVAIQGDVGSECLTCLALGCIVVSNVGVDESHSHRHREFLTQHTAISHIESHFVWVDGHSILSFTEIDLTQREETQRAAQGTVVANTIETCKVGKMDVVDQFAQPRGVRGTDACARHIEWVFGRIPVL